MSSPKPTAAELTALRLLHAQLPFMRRLSFEYVIGQPVLLGSLRNTLAAREAKAARLKALAARASVDFQLTP